MPELRLDNRWLDLRVPAHNAILRVQSKVCQAFRSSLCKRGFTEPELSLHVCLQWPKDPLSEAHLRWK